MADHKSFPRQIDAKENGQRRPDLHLPGMQRHRKRAFAFQRAQNGLPALCGVVGENAEESVMEKRLGMGKKEREPVENQHMFVRCETKGCLVWME